MSRGIGALALLAIVVGATGCATAWTPFQTGLYPPVQVFGVGTDVRGLRASAILGRNADVTGIDVAGVAAVVDGDVRGFQFSPAVNQVEGGLQGVQVAVFSNILRGESESGALDGIQLSGINRARDVQGLQIGMGNQAERIRGLQIGLFNVATGLRGVQIGLLNYIPGARIPFLPLLNFAFESERFTIGVSEGEGPP